MVVNGAEARAKHLETLSDAAKADAAWTLGVGYEFEQRADGLAALDSTYHLRWSRQPKTMDLGLLYKALEQKPGDDDRRQRHRRAACPNWISRFWQTTSTHFRPTRWRSPRASRA